MAYSFGSFRLVAFDSQPDSGLLNHWAKGYMRYGRLEQLERLGLDGVWELLHPIGFGGGWWGLRRTTRALGLNMRYTETHRNGCWQAS